jgi:hypothetical protein
VRRRKTGRCRNKKSNKKGQPEGVEGKLKDVD